MKNKYWSQLALGLLLLVSAEIMTHDEQDSGCDAHDMMALFETESEGDALASAVAQTAIMQNPLVVKPISPAVLFVRKVWDRMLIAYLWLQARYLAVYRYLKRGSAQQPAQ